MHIFTLILLCMIFGLNAWAGEQRYQGVCDASAAVIIEGSYFLVGNDEDEVLSLYSSDDPGRGTIQTFNFASSLRTNIDREVDIEGAARLGRRVYWIGSHGRSKKGKRRLNRHRLFATDISQDAQALQLSWAGRYDRLVQDMMDVQSWDEPDSRITKETVQLIAQSTRLDVKTVDELRPKHAGLNIEALAIAPDRRGLLIGFRNPLVKGKALVVHLKNPDALLAGSEQRASFSKPAYIDLAGLGLRSMAYDPARKAFFIIAGPKKKGGPFKLFRWGGMADSAPVFLRNLKYGKGSYPEALLIHEHRFQVLHDDGRRHISKRKCKKVKKEDKGFVEQWYPIDAEEAADGTTDMSRSGKN